MSLEELRDNELFLPTEERSAIAEMMKENQRLKSLLDELTDDCILQSFPDSDEHFDLIYRCRAALGKFREL